jgi:hypothetical protein
MRIASFLVCLSLALAASAADKRETRAIGSFNAIALEAPITVYLTQGCKESLVLDGDEEALAQLGTYVENGSLHLEKKTREHLRLMSKVKAYVTAREIRALAISGAGDIRSETLRTGDLKLAIAGSGDIRIAQLNASNVEASIGGSGDITVAGKADSIHGSIGGSGDLRAGKLEVGEAKVSVAGSGDVTLWTRDTISASVVGSGDVRYYGDPKVRTSIIGSGSVKRLGANGS